MLERKNLRNAAVSTFFIYSEADFLSMGISEMTDSVLMLASFERTDDVLEAAAMHSMVDKVRNSL